MFFFTSNLSVDCSGEGQDFHELAIDYIVVLYQLIQQQYAIADTNLYYTFIISQTLRAVESGTSEM